MIHKKYTREIKTFLNTVKNRVVNFQYYKHIFLVSVVYLYAFLFLIFLNLFAKKMAEIEILKEENKKCMEAKTK